MHQLLRTLARDHSGANVLIVGARDGGADELDTLLSRYELRLVGRAESAAQAEILVAQIPTDIALIAGGGSPDELETLAGKLLATWGVTAIVLTSSRATPRAGAA